MSNERSSSRFPEGRLTDRAQFPLHLKRVTAQLTVEREAPLTAPAHVILSDFSGTGLGLFTNLKMAEGETIEIRFKEPKELVLKGKVAWCEEQFVGGKVISPTRFPFRTGINFTITTEEEKAAIANFIAELHQMTQKKNTAA